MSDRLARLPQDNRVALRHALGRRFLARVDALSSEVTSGLDTYAIHLHPATTEADYGWLKQEWSGFLLEAVEAVFGADCSSTRGIADLKSSLLSLQVRAEGLRSLVQGLDHIAECDYYRGAKPLDAARTCSIGAVAAYASMVAACTAPDEGSWSIAEERFEAAVTGIAATDIALESAMLDWGDVGLAEVLHCAFRVPPAQSVHSVESCIGAYEHLDPRKGALPDTSPHVQPIPNGMGNRSDRLFAFAERQVRFLPLPSGTMDGLIAQDYMQVGFRLATERFPALAHLTGRWASHVIVSALQNDRERLQERLLEFDREDTLLVICEAPRADREMAQANGDPRRGLTAYSTLLEAVVQPWLRLMLDMHALAAGETMPRLPFNTTLTRVLNAAASAGKRDSILQVLVAPADSRLRNAASHSRALPAGGRIQIIGSGGKVERVVEAVEVETRYALLRSGFAGIDCAKTAFGYAVGWQNADVEMEASTEFVERLVRIYQAAHGLPLVTSVREDADGSVVVAAEGPWPGGEVPRMAEGLRAAVPRITHVSVDAAGEGTKP